MHFGVDCHGIVTVRREFCDRLHLRVQIRMQVAHGYQDGGMSLGLELCPSEKVSVPGLAKAIANIELVRETVAKVGDHIWSSERF